MIHLNTDRLILRNVVEKDIDIMYDYRNNEICSKYQREQTKSKIGIAELVEKHKNDFINVESPFIIALSLKDSDEMIGEIVVMPRGETISIGYTISYKYHRMGYAFESLSFLIALLHEKFPNFEFISFTDIKNEASKNLLKKLGYDDMGYYREIDSQMFGKWVIE